MAAMANCSRRDRHLLSLLGLHFSAYLLVSHTFGMNDAYSRREYEQFTCRVIVDLAALNGYNSAPRG